MAIENNRGDIGYFVTAVIVWLISAGVLLTIFSALICNTSLDSSYIGYISSFVSFMSSAVAAAYSYKNKKGEILFNSAVTALFIVIMLLTVGFLVRGEEITSAGIISVSSFTFAGFVLGANIRQLFRKKGRKTINPGIMRQKRR